MYTTKLARDIARRLARYHGIQVKIAQDTSDVGVDFVGGKKRRLATHKKRQAKGNVRLGRIATMVRANRKAASLTLTGAAPKMLWGTQATGVAPSRMRPIRSSYAFAAGTQIRGRCATIAIALRYVWGRQGPCCSPAPAPTDRVHPDVASMPWPETGRYRCVARLRGTALP